jgi:hypothetical protein
MQRVNIMISDEAKAIIKKYQQEKEYKKIDDAFDGFILEFAKEARQ